MNHQRADAMLMEILRERKTITGFLDSIFGFFMRNTDFYHIQKDTSEKIGFPKGVKERILYGAMQRYDPECKISSLVSYDNEEFTPPAVTEVEVVSDEKAAEGYQIEDSSSVNLKKTNCRITCSSSVQTSGKDFFSDVDYVSGACLENYCWSQTLKDVEIHIRLPDDMKSAKLLNIVINCGSIRITSKLKQEFVVFEGKFSYKFKHNDAVWTIAEGKLQINFDKIKEVWWEKLFIHDERIDLTKIDCTRYIDELPSESRAAIEKLRVDQIKADAESVPTKKEEETLEKLRMAWQSEGSPFQGQPFDPSMVKFN